MLELTINVDPQAKVELITTSELPGPQGIQGIQGIRGEIGPQGSQGLRGLQGETGERGERGIKGDKGETGHTGDKGEPGRDLVYENLSSANRADLTQIAIQGVAPYKSEAVAAAIDAKAYAEEAKSRERDAEQHMQGARAAAIDANNAKDATLVIKQEAEVLKQEVDAAKTDFDSKYLEVSQAVSDSNAAASLAQANANATAQTKIEVDAIKQVVQASEQAAALSSQEAGVAAQSAQGHAASSLTNANNAAASEATVTASAAAAALSESNAASSASSATSSATSASTDASTVQSVLQTVQGIQSDVDSKKTLIDAAAIQVDADKVSAAQSSASALTSKNSAAASAADAAASAAKLVSALNYGGTFDASSGNLPPVPTVNTFWRITVAGTLPIVGAVKPGGDLIYREDIAEWDYTPPFDAVVSVNSQVGSVVLTAADVDTYDKATSDARYLALHATATDSSLLEGSTKNQVIATSRQGLASQAEVTTLDAKVDAIDYATVGALPASWLPSWSQITAKPTLFPTAWSMISNIPAVASRWPTWGEVTSKPTVFQSSWTNVSDKPATATRWPAWGEVSGKPDVATRWATWGEVTGKPTSFPVQWGDVSAVPVYATRWPTWSEVGSKPATYPPATHNHDTLYYSKATSDGRYLGKHAKADDSNLLDGVDSARFMMTNAFTGDLRNAKRAGCYYVGAGSTGGPSFNVGAASMLVAKHADVQMQILGSLYEKRIAARTYNNAGTSDTGWMEFYTTARKPSKAEVGLGHVLNEVPVHHLYNSGSLTLSRGNAAVTRLVRWSSSDATITLGTDFHQGDIIEIVNVQEASGTITIASQGGAVIFTPDSSNSASHTFTGRGTIRIVKYDTSNNFMILSVNL